MKQQGCFGIYSRKWRGLGVKKDVIGYDG